MHLSLSLLCSSPLLPLFDYLIPTIRAGMEEEVLLNNDSASDVIQLNDDDDEEDRARETPLPVVDESLRQLPFQPVSGRRHLNHGNTGLASASPSSLPPPPPSPPPLAPRRSFPPHVRATWMKGTDEDDDASTIATSASATTRLSRRSAASMLLREGGAGSSTSLSPAESPRSTSVEPPSNSFTAEVPTAKGNHFLASLAGSSASSFSSKARRLAKMSQSASSSSSSLRLFTKGATEPDALKASVAGFLCAEEQLDRVSKGRKYRICGKRTTSRGKVHYLVQFDEDGASL